MSIERFFKHPTDIVDYLVNVSEKFGYLYLANLKVASSSILGTLQLAEVGDDSSKVPQNVHERSESPLLNFKTSRFSPDEILNSERVFKFTYVRNPYSRVLSAYLDKIVRQPSERARLLPTLGFPAEAEPSFLEFLQAIHASRDAWRDLHWMTQSKLIEVNHINYNFVGRFESFQLSFPLLLQRLGISESSFKQIEKPTNVTRANELIMQYVGDAERDLIISIYEADFVNFRYGFDPTVAHF
jgi:hypothetical protein